MILFLNKDDLFQECILNDVPLSTCFSEKNGAIWKKEYVNDQSYNKKGAGPKIYAKNTANSEDDERGRGRTASTDPIINHSDNNNNNKKQNNILSSSYGNQYNNRHINTDNNKLQTLHRVHNESDSLSYSQDTMSLTEEEYRKRCAIYPKSYLRYTAKDTYNNGEWKNRSDEDWFQYIYVDYLNFITEQYSSMNLLGLNKRVFKHVTTATDGDNVEKVFWDVQNIVIRSNLSKGGLM